MSERNRNQETRTARTHATRTNTPTQPPRTSKRTFAIAGQAGPGHQVGPSARAAIENSIYQADACSFLTLARDRKEAVKTRSDVEIKMNANLHFGDQVLCVPHS